MPWTRAGAGGQAATLGAFGVVAGLAAVCASRLAAALPPGGPVTWAAWGVIGCAFGAGCVAGISDAHGTGGLMLSPADVLVLPEGVRVDGNALVDEVRLESFALNAAGHDVVANDGRPLAGAVADLRSRWGLSQEQAERDVLAFAWVLNRVFLANVRRVGSPVRRLLDWLLLAARLLPLGIAPPVLNRRYALDTSSYWSSLQGTVAAVWRRCLGVCLGGLGASLPLLVGASASAVVTWVVVGVAAGTAIASHEVGHALALRGIPAALVSSGLALSVLHAASSRRRAAVIGICGPALPSAIAVLVTTLALPAGSLSAGMASCPFAAHALTATLAGRDGRSACRS